MRVLLRAGLAAAALTIAAAAWADAPRVVLLGGPGDPVLTKVRDELRVLGVEVDLAPPDEARALPEVARARGAAAAARVEVWPPEIVIWIRPSDPGAAEPPREIRVSDALSGPVEPGLLALRAIELLRGALIPVERSAGEPPASEEAAAAVSPPPDPAPAAAPAPPVPAAAGSAPASHSTASAPPAPPAPDRVEAAAPSKAPRRFALFAGPALVAGAGGVPPAFGAGLGATWSALPRAGLEVIGHVPITASVIGAPEGSIALRAGLLGAGAWLRMSDPASALRLSVSAGLAALVLAFEGEPRAPWLAQAGSRWAALPYLRAVAAYRLHPAAALRADLAVGLALPEPVVRIAGRDVASFGQPAVLPSLALELWP